ncbi:MAG: TonB-dependent receptor [Acidobacteriota bacterium]|nr:TonB-dependent receptor [Acidobacteriota bacterium]
MTSLVSSQAAVGDHGSVTGVLTDSAGGVLQGARVALEPTDSKATSDRQGVYTFADVAPGAYTVSVSFIGFAPYTTSVTVVAGQTIHADATLSVAQQTQAVIVTDARPHGEAEAINRERSAENILQVLPAEVITSLPNANVADAIGRLPSVTLERDEGEGKYVQIRGTEPRYSNVTIDGVNVPSPESGPRQIKLDVIPSDLVESVEISKTLLANQDGDAIGGSVNLRTRTASDQPTISLYGMGGLTPIFNTRGTDEFGGTIGKRFGNDGRLGILFGGTYDWNGRGINDVEPAPQTIQCDPGNCGVNLSPNASYFGTYSGADLRDYRYDRTRFGFEGSVDYKLNDASSVYVKGLYSHFDNFGDRWVYSPAVNSYTTSALQGGPDGSVSSNTQIRRPVQVIGSMVAGGRQGWGASTFTWEVSAARSATEDKGYSQANFSPTADSVLKSVQYGINIANPYRPKFIVQNGLNIYDASQYALNSSDATDFNRTYSPQLNLAAAASYSRGYNLAGHLGTFELGGKFRNAHKFQESRDNYYNLQEGANVPMTQFLSTLTDKNYYDNSYTQGPFVDYNKFTSFFNTNGNLFTLNSSLTHQRNDPNNWNLLERVSAGYLMNTIEFGKWRLYTGLRFEATNEDVLGRHVLFDSKGDYVTTTAATQNAGYIDALPSAELRYALTSDSGIRFAYGRGIARPNYGDLPPYLSVDDSNHRVSMGNPNLKPTHANNYDILYEHYLNPLGVIQGGVFYKQISDPIYSITQNVVGVYSPPPIVYHQSQSVNGTRAWVAGFEAAFEQRLSYLPAPMSGLGISANYSYTNSRAGGLEGLLGRSDHPHLQRQAPHTWNVSPTYDKGRVSLRVGIAYNAANIFSYQYSDGAPLGLNGPNGDQYLYTHLQVDAQASIRLNKGFSAVVYGLNLNNEVFGFYQGSGIWPIQREYYQPTYGVGVRWNPISQRF